jgi:hypothetical protein
MTSRWLTMYQLATCENFEWLQDDPNRDIALTSEMGEGGEPPEGVRGHDAGVPGRVSAAMTASQSQAPVTSRDSPAHREPGANRL